MLQLHGGGAQQDECYYDENGNWVNPRHDAEGRLLKLVKNVVNYDEMPENLDTYVSKWETVKLSSKIDWDWTSRFAWPDIKDSIVHLKRLDVYQTDAPISQQATTDITLSRKMRNTPGWYPVQSIFFLDVPTPMTFELKIEATGPPRRHMFRPSNKSNPRDLSSWVEKEKVLAYIGPDRIPGTTAFYVDYCDLPDRYFISHSSDAILGRRRLYRLAAYASVQYFVLEKRVFHELLAEEGGYGTTYQIVEGPIPFAQYGWRVIGSFYGFTHQLPSTSRYTVYQRQDPFPRMLIALEAIQNAEEWDSSISFYAFDIPIPNTALYTVQHCLRSIYSTNAAIPRHRITTQESRLPWEFRMNLYLFPADLEDCTFTTTPSVKTTWAAAEEEGYAEDDYAYAAHIDG